MKIPDPGIFIRNYVKNKHKFAEYFYSLFNSCILLLFFLEFSSTVFKDKMEALKLVKKYKSARFKTFKSYIDAVEFSRNGMIISPNCNNNILSSSNAGGDGLSIASTDYSSLNTIGEKPSPFKGPKSQDFVRLRKAIESNDIQFVEKAIWDNPRYLVSSGDTPAILHVNIYIYFFTFFFYTFKFFI